MSALEKDPERSPVDHEQPPAVDEEMFDPENSFVDDADQGPEHSAVISHETRDDDSGFTNASFVLRHTPMKPMASCFDPALRGDSLGDESDSSNQSESPTRQIQFRKVTSSGTRSQGPGSSTSQGDRGSAPAWNQPMHIPPPSELEEVSFRSRHTISNSFDSVLSGSFEVGPSVSQKRMASDMSPGASKSSPHVVRTKRPTILPRCEQDVATRDWFSPEYQSSETAGYDSISSPGPLDLSAEQPMECDEGDDREEDERIAEIVGTPRPARQADVKANESVRQLCAAYPARPRKLGRKR